MSTYRFELSWDDLLLVLPTPGAATVGSGLRLAFGIRFTDSGAVTHNAAPQLDMLIHSFGGGPTYEFRTQQQFVPNGVTADPTNFGAPSNAVVEANGQNGAAFRTTPVTLAVTLDDSAHTVAVEGPLGTQSYTFAAMGWANGAISAPSLQGIGFGISDFDGTEDVTFEAALYNFYLSKDGARIAGAQMGTNQPGTWTNAWHVDSGLSTVGISGTSSISESRAVESINYDHTHFSGSTNAGWFRTFGGGLADVETVLALLCHQEGGALVYARVTKQAVDAVEIGYSDDSGHTWATVMAGQSAGRFYNSPSLAEGPDGSINLFVSDRTAKQTRWFKSETRGRTWIDFGVLLSLLPWSTITHPRVFSLASGFFVVSYNQGGHWFIAVYDGGITASFGIQTTDMGANIGGLDAFPALFQAGRGWVYAAEAYSVLNETLERSTNWGVNWTTVYSSPLGTLHIAAANSIFSGFIWKAWQDPTGTIFAAPSDTDGGSYVHPPVIVFASAEPQFFGLAVLPKGYPLIVFQSYNSGTDVWQIAGYFSPDLGASWIAS